MTLWESRAYYRFTCHSTFFDLVCGIDHRLVPFIIDFGVLESKLTHGFLKFFDVRFARFNVVCDRTLATARGKSRKIRLNVPK